VGVIQQLDVPGAVQALGRGEAVAFPTPCGYGLALDPFLSGCAGRLAALKPGRVNPVGLIAGNLEQVDGVATIPRGAQKWLEQWPAELTLVLPARSGLPAPIVSPEGGVAVRIPFAVEARELALGYGAVLTATSANLPGASPARTLEELAELGLPFLRSTLPGSPGREPPSAIVSLLEASPRLLRPGAACPSLP
jgi:L-threonylcarbamoyladenylate synthase